MDGLEARRALTLTCVLTWVARDRTGAHTSRDSMHTEPYESWPHDARVPVSVTDLTSAGMCVRSGAMLSCYSETR